MKTLRIAFIGGGRMALRQASALLAAGFPQKGFVAVYDRELSVARAFADRFGAEPRVSSRAALQAATHAVIATSAAAHAPEAIEALTMRRGVFVEKPLALTLRAGAALTILADRLNLPLHVGLSERFHPVVQALVADLDGQAIESFHAVRCLPAMRARDCSVGLNLAIHDFDLALEITRSRLTVDAASTRCSRNRFHAQLRGHRGETIAVTAADGVEAASRTLTVNAGEARYEGDLLAGTLHKIVDGQSISIPVADADGLASQAAALLAVWTGQSLVGPATALDAFRGLALLARATRLDATKGALAPGNLPQSRTLG